MRNQNVSVILTTYNGASRGYLVESIKSVLSQTYQNYELLIIDDGSVDNTKAICEKYLSNSKVKYIYQENRGLAAARNIGIKNSKGEYICFLDDDDVWKPEKLEKEIKFFENYQDKKIGMVFTSLELINKDGRKIAIQSHIAKGNIYGELFYKNIVDAPSSVMIKREVFEKVGLFREYMMSCQDYELWFRIAKHYHVYSINETLVKYRVHQNKMSTNCKKGEFYRFVTLFLALQNAPSDIREKENDIYSNLYIKFANKHFGLRNYSEFRKYYKIAKAYGGTDTKLKSKYLLSYFPKVVEFLKGAKTFLKRRL